jgi:hypothetical protein
MWAMYSLSGNILEKVGSRPRRARISSLVRGGGCWLLVGDAPSPVVLCEEAEELESVGRGIGSRCKEE